MRIAALLERILLGLVFVVFGANGFLNFIPAGPMPTGPAGEFATVLVQSHYVLVVSAIEFLGGLLLLVNRYVPLGLVLLGPVIVNILLFHLLLFHTGWPIAVLVAVLWCIVALRNRQHFSGIFVQRTS